ncbi:MAG: prepilin-type N-terminal cleavage/methylation domain-containing protein [Patescibacteria group bacterium]
MSQTKNQGFTVIELLVAIGIIVLISGIVLASVRKGEQSLTLDRAAHKVARDIRKAADLSLRAEPYTGGGCAGFSGYGIHFDTQNADTKKCYLVYVECGGSPGYQGQRCDGGGGGVDRQKEVLGFEKGVRIREVNPSPQFNVFFLPPDPTIFIEPGAVAEGTITLELENDPSQTKTITVNKSGMVDLQ